MGNNPVIQFQVFELLFIVVHCSDSFARISQSKCCTFDFPELLPLLTSTAEVTLGILLKIIYVYDAKIMVDIHNGVCYNTAVVNKERCPSGLWSWS